MSANSADRSSRDDEDVPYDAARSGNFKADTEDLTAASAKDLTPASSQDNSVGETLEEYNRLWRIPRIKSLLAKRKVVRPLVRGSAPSASVSSAMAKGGQSPDGGATARPPYALSGLARPKYRGMLMGWLHNTRLWYALSVAYVFAVLGLVVSCRLARPVDTFALASRIALVAASSFSVYLSDRYHNADKRPEGVTPEGELDCLRLDYIGISFILSTNFWLWAGNLDFVRGLGRLGVASALASLNVLANSAFVVPRYAGHIAVKLTLAVQFVGLLGYLALVALASPSPVCAVIYASYIPGFILYATKFPNRRDFGYHECFHVSVLVGNLLSMAFDLRRLGLF